MNRENRMKIAEDTLRTLNQGFYLNSLGEKVDFMKAQQYAENNTKVYEPSETDKLIAKNILDIQNVQVKFKVLNDTTLNVVRQMLEEGHKKIICLNFASARNPGGGFQNGSSAQEESLARATGLYPCISKCNDYYLSNRNTKSCIYTDYIIYSPDVPILKDEDGHYLFDISKVSIITAPAVNSNVVRQQEPMRVPEIEIVMRRRIEKVLRIAVEYNYKHLVLGAWGCGVFGNAPNEISRYFKEIIDSKFKGQFENIIFAVYSNDARFIEPFYEHFNP